MKAHRSKPQRPLSVSRISSFDENKTPHGNPMSYEEYVNRYWIWLLDQYSKQVEKENEPIK